MNKFLTSYIATRLNHIPLNTQVFVGRFVPRKEREIELGEKAKRFTNVYVKNFNEAMTEDDLSKMFEKFGKITSLKVIHCRLSLIRAGQQAK